jgi:hypothetical protein
MQRRTPISQRAVCGLFALALTATLTLFSTAQARIFFDKADPALNGATIVPLGETRFFPGQFSALLLEDGHEFQFDTAAPEGFFTDTAFGPPGRFVSFFPGGVEIGIAPGVGAIGFQYDFAECTGVIEVIGATATENFMFPFGDSNRFVGAADISDIESVILNGACFAAVWSEMCFVPASGGPPPDAEADLAAVKTGPGIASQLDGTLDFELGRIIKGPIPQRTRRSSIFCRRAPQLSVRIPPPCSARTVAPRPRTSVTLRPTTLRRACSPRPFRRSAMRPSGAAYSIATLR